MTEQIQKVCVTGGAGFIGSHLVEGLLDRGHEVTVLDDLSVGRRENLPAAARLIEGDVLDEGAVRNAVEGCHAVFHLAARVAIRSSFEFVVDDARTNLVGTANVLRVAGDIDSIHRVVTTSSMAVYADADSPVPIDEHHPTVPVSPYGVSKLAAERLTHMMCERNGQKSTVLRLFNTFGPRQTLSPYVGVVTIFANKLDSGEPPTIFGDGEQCRDFVHVRDVVAAYLGALDSDVTGETFNVGTGKATSVNNVLEAVRRALGAKVEPEHAPAVTGELRYSIADIAKAGRMLDYRPRHVFESSISEVVSEIVRGSC